MTTTARRWGTTSALVVVAVGLIYAPGVLPAVATPQHSGFEIVDLGTLPGGTQSRAGLVDNAGTVVGQANVADGYWHAVRWRRHGGITDLGVLPGYTQSLVTAMNGKGDIVGMSNAPATISNTAVRWDRRGRIIALAPGTPSETVDINDNGTIVGHMATDAGEHRAVAWHRTGGVDFLPVLPDATNSYAAGISARGTVGGRLQNIFVGGPEYAVRWDRRSALEVLDQYPGSWGLWVAGIDDHDLVVGMVRIPQGSRAVRWDTAGRVAELGLPPGAIESVPTFVSAGGAVLGIVRTPDRQYAVRWDGQGQPTVLDVPGSLSTSAAGVNRHGVVVGQATMPDFTTRAVQWDRRGRVTVLPVLPGGSHAGAAAINDSGTIAGYAITPDTLEQHAVVWHTGRG